MYLAIKKGNGYTYTEDFMGSLKVWKTLAGCSRSTERGVEVKNRRVGSGNEGGVTEWYW